jgi:hypothetical protein
MRSIGLLIALTGLLLFIGCGSSESSLKEEKEGTIENSCTEPLNPYREGSGHYAGYEWAEKSGGDLAVLHRIRSTKAVRSTRARNLNIKAAKPRGNASDQPLLRPTANRASCGQDLRSRNTRQCASSLLHMRTSARRGLRTFVLRS